MRTVPHEQAKPLLTLTIEWSGPHTLKEVVREFKRGGSAPEYNGPDYGLYKIYGTHILAGSDTLLYIGKATQQTFSARFYAHRSWLAHEEGITIYLGRTYDRERHLPGPMNDWPVWVQDVEIAEHVMIYKYSPNYNSVSISDPPSLEPYRRAVLKHSGRRHCVQAQDIAPMDWES